MKSLCVCGPLLHQSTVLCCDTCNVILKYFASCLLLLVAAAHQVEQVKY